jgi:hypothetical protein
VTTPIVSIVIMTCRMLSSTRHTESHLVLIGIIGWPLTLNPVQPLADAPHNALRITGHAADRLYDRLIVVCRRDRADEQKRALANGMKMARFMVASFLR